METLVNHVPSARLGKCLLISHWINHQENLRDLDKPTVTNVLLR
jgi:hypothetical protein